MMKNHKTKRIIRFHHEDGLTLKSPMREQVLYIEAILVNKIERMFKEREKKNDHYSVPKFISSSGHPSNARK